VLIASTPLAFSGLMTFTGFSPDTVETCNIEFQFGAVFVGPVN
jgi:hypothetical protein